MAVIGKIRSYSGLLIAVIGIALGAFVLGDFLGYGSGGAQRNMDIGKIDKHSISYIDFERRVTDRIESWRVETGQQTVNEADAFQMRQQVWNNMIREIILGQELERIGVDVTSEELYDMIHGQNPHDLIVRSFTNPADGSYDQEAVVNFFRNFNQLDPSVQTQWTQLERFMKQERLEDKYHTLIREAYHVPALLAAMDFQDRNASADFRFVFMPYAEIADSLVKVSDRDLRRVFDENKETFRQEASRDIAYVSFDVRATDADRESFISELNAIKDEFAAVEDIGPFVNSLSDMRYDPRFFSRGQLPLEVEDLFFESEPGLVHGPFLEENAFMLARLVDAQMRPDSMRASHILFSWSGATSADPQLIRNPERARELADSVLEVVRNNPARFTELASELSDDASAATNQGDLDWFADGAMVPGFNEAVMNTPTGGFTVAETDFGFHVVQVTGKSSLTKKVQVAFVTRDIEPGSQTYQAVYAEASTFASELRNNKNFMQVADEKGLAVRVAENIGEMDFMIPGIDNPRSIIHWAFLEETRIGGFSRIFELDNRFIIATVTALRKEGIPSSEQVRDEVMALAMQEKKFEMIAERMRSAGGNLGEMAAKLEKEPITATDIRFNTVNLPVAGNEPKVIGTAFAMADNTLSAPVKGNNGVFVLEMQRLEMAILPDDMEANKRMMQGNVINRVNMEVFQAVMDKTRMEDNRSLFY